MKDFTALFLLFVLDNEAVGSLANNMPYEDIKVEFTDKEYVELYLKFRYNGTQTNVHGQYFTQATAKEGTQPYVKAYSGLFDDDSF